MVKPTIHKRLGMLITPLQQAREFEVSGSPVTGVFMESSTGDMPKVFSLEQNYPNPFNSSTNIYYTLSKASQVRLVIYNALGQKVRIIVNDFQAAGPYIKRWEGLMDNGLAAPSGVYFYEIFAQNGEQSFKQVRKMVLTGIGPDPTDIAATARLYLSTTTYFAFITNRGGNSVSVFESGPNWPIVTGPDDVFYTRYAGSM